MRHFWLALGMALLCPWSFALAEEGAKFPPYPDVWFVRKPVPTADSEGPRWSWTPAADGDVFIRVFSVLPNNRINKGIFSPFTGEKSEAEYDSELGRWQRANENQPRDTDLKLRDGGVVAQSGLPPGEWGWEPYTECTPPLMLVEKTDRSGRVVSRKVPVLISKAPAFEHHICGGIGRELSREVVRWDALPAQDFIPLRDETFLSVFFEKGAIVVARFRADGTNGGAQPDVVMVDAEAVWKVIESAIRPFSDDELRPPLQPIISEIAAHVRNGTIK